MHVCMCVCIYNMYLVIYLFMCVCLYVFIVFFLSSFFLYIFVYLETSILITDKNKPETKLISYETENVEIARHKFAYFKSTFTNN